MPTPPIPPVPAPDWARETLALTPRPTPDALYALRLWHATECLHARQLAANPERSPAVLAKHAARAENHERCIQALAYLGALLHLEAGAAPHAPEARLARIPEPVHGGHQEPDHGTDPAHTPDDDDLSA